MSHLEKEEASLGRWPRRLLHVPTLTSCLWQHGNVYGNVIEPKYNALTYTWGRWRLRDNEKPAVLSLPVQNVSWQMPRVDPEHFTLEQLKTVLQTATSKCKSPNGLNLWYDQVEFIWLDVACIDQRSEQAESAAEIGRQAQIFQGAQAVFFWVSSIDRGPLESTLEQIQEFLDEQPDIDLLLKAWPGFKKLLEDPWFTSLWTLQEAFLRRDSVCISQPGILVQQTRRSHDKLRKEPVPLSRVFEHANDMLMYIAESVQDNAKHAALLEEMLDYLERRGPFGLSTRNPMASFTAISYRTASREEDRVYGIQQIFDLRLGTSAVNLQSIVEPRSTRHYTLPELQDQLGEQLMLKDPILSQTHIYSKAVPTGKAWRVNESSIVPRLTDIISSSMDDPDDRDFAPFPVVWRPNGSPPHDRARCQLGVCLIEDNIWGRFQAKLCFFHVFHTMILEYESQSHAIVSTFLDIWPDETAELENRPEEYKGHITASRQRAFAHWLLDTFREEDLHVLMLGQEYGESRIGGDMLGLLMVRKNLGEMQYWHRIALCRWKITHMIDDGSDERLREWFEGDTWDVVEGIFG